MSSYIINEHKMDFSIIAAADKNMGIGKDNALPWRLRGELHYFTETTIKAPEGERNAVIMGLNTWLSLPEAHRPLKDRVNVILSKDPVELPKGVINAGSFDQAFEKIEELENVAEVFVIGGASIYAQAIKLDNCARVYLTEIEQEFDCDTFFPEIDTGIFKKVSSSDLQQEKEVSYRFCVYEKV